MALTTEGVPEHVTSDVSCVTPFITAVIPCRNESKHIGACIESIVRCAYPKDSLEVFVVDGLSDDDSKEIALRYERRYPYIKVLDNPRKILAAAWNLGIRNARGDIIVAMNAHAEIEPDHFAQCVRYLDEYNADCVGPVIVTHPQDTTMVGKAIAAAMSSPFGVGDSKFRTGVGTPSWVDTVHFGAYRRDVFDRVGHHNEELVRSQDIDLHKRLLKAGGRILLVPSLNVHYYTRTNPKQFTKFGFINGYWVTYPYRFGSFIGSVRHMIPLVFVLALALSALLATTVDLAGYVFVAIVTSYSALALYFSARAAVRARRPSYLTLMPLVFLTYHSTYGIGSLVGLVKAMWSVRFWREVWARLKRVDRYSD